ncbi:MAG: AAA family ATPase [Peptococcaceae bacterium]|nr:AAA family ATPase [Peptococcaceae bacterium]
MGHIIALVNQKGGVAKTTTAINLAASLNKKKKKVLLVDLDPQGNATSGIGVDKNELTHSVYDCLIGDVPASEVIVRTYRHGLDLLPSNVNLAGAEHELGYLEDRGTRLRHVLATMADDYDYILMDCPPSLGMITINALSAAEQLFVPIQSEYYALEGVEQLMQTVSLVKQSYNPELYVGGVIITMYDGRMRLSRDVVDTVTATFGDVVFKTMIPRNVRLAEAPSYGRAIIDYEALSKGALAYNALAKEVIKRG